MLRLPPTSITLDAQDIERHTVNGTQKIKQMIAQGMKERNVFGYPFPPLCTSDNSAVREIIDEKHIQLDKPKLQHRVSEQILRDTVFPNKSRHRVGGSLDDTTNLRPAKVELVPLYRDLESVSSFDGLFEHPPRGIRKVTSTHPSKGRQASDYSSRRVSGRAASIDSDIEDLTEQFKDLYTKRKGYDSKSAAANTPSSSKAESRQRQITPASEPRLPPPFSQTPRAASTRNALPMNLGRDYYSSPTRYEAHASPARSSRHSTPIHSTSMHSPQISTTNYFLQRYSPAHGMTTQFGRVSGQDLHQRSFPGATSTHQHFTSHQLFSHNPLDLNPSDSSPQASIRRRRPALEPMDTPPRASHTSLFTSSPPVFPGVPRLNRPYGMSIYNDNLPAAIQPQTPIGLPRHGLPYTRIPVTYTAPQYRSGHVPFAHPITPTRRSQRPATPSPMLGLGTSIQGLPSHGDQENAARFAEWERRRRFIAEGSYIIRQGGGTLNRIPPRNPETGA